jgi:hypothetical protein
MKPPPMNNFPDKELLQKFLNDELDTRELALVLSRIKQNEPSDEFSAGVKSYLEAHEYEYKSIIEWNTGAMQRAKQKLAPAKNKQFSIWSKIAAILILSLSVYWIYQRNFTDSDTWKKYYSTDPGLPVFMAAGNPDSWMQTYRAGQYAQTLEAINKNLENKPLNDTLLYYKLVCLFETDQLMPQASFTLPASSYYLENSKLLFAYSFWKNGDEKAAYLRFKELAESPIENVRANSKKALKALEQSH